MRATNPGSTWQAAGPAPLLSAVPIPTGIETAFVFLPGIPPKLHDAPSVTFALDDAHLDDLPGMITIAQETDAAGAANLTAAESLRPSGSGGWDAAGHRAERPSPPRSFQPPRSHRDRDGFRSGRATTTGAC